MTVQLTEVEFIARCLAAFVVGGSLLIAHATGERVALAIGRRIRRR